MTDLEAAVRADLEQEVPAVPTHLGDWADVLARAGEDDGARRTRRKVAALALVGAAFATLVLTPLVGAIARGAGGFSDWLVGTPGEPVEPEAQREFERVTRFPDNPQLRRLLHVELDGRTFSLYGFETGNVVCLRVAVRAPQGAGPESSCVSRDDLRRSGDSVMPLRANLGVEQLGPPPRTASDPPTIPRYRITFGVAAAEVESVLVETDDGRSRASVRNGAFLHVFEPGRHGNWGRTVTATVRGGGTSVVPLSVQASGQRAFATGLPLRGPAAVEREVPAGAIGWFDRREPRGSSAQAAGLSRSRPCCTGFVRVLHPDPDDFLAVALGDRSLWAGGALTPLGADAVCHGLVTRGGTGGSCGPRADLFRRGPLRLNWGFSGAGQQIWIVHGLVSDDVARLRVFLGSGETWDAPLRDNATAFRVQRAKFPIRLVAYDRGGRVIGVQSIRGG